MKATQRSIGLLPGIIMSISLVGTPSLMGAVVLDLGPGGAASLRNSGPEAVFVSTYTITREPGGVELLPSGWSSLEAQGEPFTVGSASAEVLAETVNNGSGITLEIGESRYIGNPFALLSDTNGDGAVNSIDLNIVGSNWQQNANGPENGDFNFDGIVDSLDLNILAIEWLTEIQYSLDVSSTPVPEPSVVSPLFAGSFLLLGFRRSRRT